MTAAADKSPLFSPGGWRTAVIYFGLVSFGFAQPVFESVTTFRRQFHFGPADAVLIVLVFQYLAAAAPIAVRRLLPAGKWRVGLDVVLVLACVSMALRQAKVTHLNDLVAQDYRWLLAAGLIAAALAAATVLRRFFMRAVFYAGLVAPVFGVLFIYSAAGRAPQAAAVEKPAASVPASAADAPAAAPAVVIVVMDQMSTEILRTPESGGGVDADMFPNFARAAARGVWWTNAVTNYSFSKFSFPSFLTSKLEYGSATNLETLKPPNLFSIFEDAGWKIHVYSDYFGCTGQRFECTSYLDARRPGFLFKVFRNFIETYGPDALLNRFFPSFFYSRVMESNAHLIETVRGAEPGALHLLHLFTTHSPYVIGPNGNYRFSEHRHFSWDSDLDAVFANFLGQVRYMDRVLGETLDAAEARPLDRPLVLLLMSDHGECWTSECPGRGYNAVEMTVVEPSLVNIPVMLISPFQAPRRDEDDFQLIDITPTLCRAAGLKGCAEHGFEGVPRLNSPPPEGRKRRFFPIVVPGEADIPLPAARVRLQ